MWDETIAGRGGREIPSCLLRYILSLPPTTEHITLWADCCGGQNRNIYVEVMLQYPLSESRRLGYDIKLTDQKFLVPGHTHMEADSIHALIEKERKRICETKIETPHDWQLFISMTQRENPLQVVSMEKESFKDFRVLLGKDGPFLNRKRNTDGDPMRWLDACEFRHSSEHPGIVRYKTDYRGTYKALDLNRRARRSAVYPGENGSLPPIRVEKRRLSREKCEDLLSMSPFLSDSAKSYFSGLEPDDTISEEIHPEIDTDDQVGPL